MRTSLSTSMCVAIIAATSSIAHSQAPASGFPTPLRIADCQAMRREIVQLSSEKRERYQRGCWERVGGQNGVGYKIDLGLIQSFAAGATAAIYKDEGGAFNVMHLKRWYFTCLGHFSVMEDRGGLGQMIYAPPRSIAARISDIVCLGAGVRKRGN